MRRSFFAILLVVLVPAMIAAMTADDDNAGTTAPIIAPQVPDADRNAPGRIFLEHADLLRKAPGDSFLVLQGNVEFTKGPMIMRCDSAHYFTDTESMDAFGNVSMEQGDTLFVYADELNYRGPEEIAYLYADAGKKVRLINRDVMLETDQFIYDLRTDLGYYTVGGVLTDKQNRLTSVEGEYVPSTKEANFYINVHLNSRGEKDTLDIYTDSLYYSTATHIAELNAPSEIVNARGTIYTRHGIYATDSDRCTLYDRSTVVASQGQTLVADTIYYDRRAGYGEGFGAMVLTDTANHTQLLGEYGFFNELTDSAFVTGRAEMREFSQADTLYMHGRYINSWRVIDTIDIAADTLAGRPEATQRIDTTHIAIAYPRVRFYRRDMQGICDTLRYTQADSTMRMFVHPVVWSDNQQIYGNVIEVVLNDSTIDRAKLPDFGMAALQIEGEYYNQISGKEMTARFINGEMRHLYINGNVQIVMFPEESDSTVNKVVNATSSFLEADFKGRVTERVKMWPETTGTATPLYLAKRSLFFLPRFRWLGDMRPASRDDIFIVPQSMEEAISGWTGF